MGGVSVDGGLNSNEADRSEDMEPVRGEWQEMEPVRGEWPRKAADTGGPCTGACIFRCGRRRPWSSEGTSRTGYEERVCLGMWTLAMSRRGGDGA